MSLKLEHLIKPFSAMSEEEQLELIRRVRHNRFTIRETKAKKKATKEKTKTEARSKSKTRKALKAALAALTPEEREALLERASNED